ncbi:MAG: TonB family protein [Crocinitomix sp.]|nr:TonB family protein [Crocinitomix sp.]
MIAKKNPKADLEKNRFAFFQIGLIVAGSLCLAAFEYSTVQEAPMAQFNIDPNTNTILPFDEILQEPSEPQEKKQRVMTEDVIVTEKIVADPVPTPEPEPIIDPVIGGGTTIGTIIAPPIIYEVPEIDPSFPGGQAGMAEFINKYIVIANYMMDDAGGTVYISFVVNKDGSIEQSKVIGSVSDALDKAALDVIARMPKWTPGEQDGKSVRSRLTIPINIQLR